LNCYGGRIFIFFDSVRLKGAEHEFFPVQA
jgi:hypothetical protein